MEYVGLEKTFVEELRRVLAKQEIPPGTKPEWARTFPGVSRLLNVEPRFSTMGARRGLIFEEIFLEMQPKEKREPVNQGSVAAA